MAQDDFEFTLMIDAAKLAAECGDGPYELKWFYDDDAQGCTAPTPRVADEVTFMLAEKFSAHRSPSTGGISRLLQLTVLEVFPLTQSRSQVGVLLIDLNAHVPRPPQQFSRQRATLSLSRCTTSKPILLRITIECVVASAPDTSQKPSLEQRKINGSVDKAAVVDEPSCPREAGQEKRLAKSKESSRSEGRSQLAARVSPTSKQGEENAQLQRQIADLTSKLANMKETNATLQDENGILKNAVSVARSEPAYTYSASRDGSEGGAKMEIATLKAEITVLQKAVMQSKEQIRNLLEREESLRSELSAHARANASLQEENSRLERELVETRQAKQDDQQAVADAVGMKDALQRAEDSLREARGAQHAAEERLKESAKEQEELKLQLSRVAAERDTASSELDTVQYESTERIVRLETNLESRQQQLQKLHAHCVTVTTTAQSLAAAHKKLVAKYNTKIRTVASLRSLVLALHTACQKPVAGKGNRDTPHLLRLQPGA